MNCYRERESVREEENIFFVNSKEKEWKCRGFRSKMILFTGWIEFFLCFLYIFSPLNSSYRKNVWKKNFSFLCCLESKRKENCKGARKSIKNVIMTVIAQNKLYFVVICYITWRKSKWMNYFLKKKTLIDYFMLLYTKYIT